MLAAGDLTWRVTLQQPGTQVDPRFGSALPGGWSDVATVWAQRLPVSDAERVRAGQTGAVLTDRWRIRWSPEVAVAGARWRLVETESGQVFGVSAIKEVERRQVLELTTSAADD